MLARGVAHEFNNIFAAIKGITSLLQPEVEAASEAAFYLNKMDSLVDRGVKLIENLSSYARLREPNAQRISVGEFFDGFTSLMDYVMPKDVKLEFHLEAEGTVEADPNSLRQAFFNIVQNGLDAMEPREDKRIRVAVTELRAESLQGALLRFSTPEVLLVSIADSGPGISDELAGRIFEPYYSTKNPQHSSGLGLNVSQQIARRHGGVLLEERSSSLG